MTNDQLITFCRRCHNRRLDINQGLLCSISNAKPDFIESCENFDLDERIQKELEASPALSPSELLDSISPEKLELLRANQNLPLAVIGGIFTGLVGAVLWAIITVATGWQIGYMALAIGAGVGFTIRYLGNGIDQIFGISGALIAVISCIIGNFLGVLGFISEAEGLSYMETLLYFEYRFTFELIAETAQFMDLAFYAIAGFEGYKFAFRQLNPSQLSELK